MFAYWGLYSLAAVLTLSFSGRRVPSNVPWFFFGALMVVMIGLRHEIGCDWSSYLGYFIRANQSTVGELLQLSDPGYQLVNWVAAEMGWGIYGTNVICAAIFAYGLITFCRVQPNPWLALAVSVPYVVVVVSMGYTRQAVAIGLVFWGLAALEQRQLSRYLAAVALATLFHKTAVLMIPLGLFLLGSGWLIRALAVLLVGVGLWAAFLADYQAQLWDSYVTQDMRSHGARVRVLMNVVPALFLLGIWPRWKRYYPNSRIWLWLAFGALACVPLLAVTSTATDRIALYITPLQVVVLSRFPYLFPKRDFANLIVAGVLMGYAGTLFVWLNYARHAFCWLPYDNLIMQ